MRKALRDGGWRYPALFALVVQVVGGVNATALIFAGVGPVLWIAVRVAASPREVQLARARSASTVRIGVLTLVTSLWWIAGLSDAGRLRPRHPEVHRDASKRSRRTSTPNEVLRGLGYWFFYGRDRLGPWIEAARDYTQQPARASSPGYGARRRSRCSRPAFVRWRHRAFFVVLAARRRRHRGRRASRTTSPTPLGALFKAFATSSTAGLALRSTGARRAARRARARGAARRRRERGRTALRRRGAAGARRSRVPCVVGRCLIVVNLPALLDGTFYGKNLQRPEDDPAVLDAARSPRSTPGDHDTRVLEMPGRRLRVVPLGQHRRPDHARAHGPAVRRARADPVRRRRARADLLNALDRRIQEGVARSRRASPRCARRMGVGDVVLRNDLQYERYDLVSPRELARVLRGSARPR